MKNCFNYFSYPLVGAVLGLVTAILFITVGFIETVFIYIMILVGAYLGLQAEANNFLKRIKNLMK